MSILVGALVGIGVLLILFSCIGAMVMRDPYQRLHYIAPPASIAPFFFAIALFVGESDRAAGWKMFLVFILLNATNGVVTHATARAMRIRSGKPIGDLTAEERA